MRIRAGRFTVRTLSSLYAALLSSLSGRRPSSPDNPTVKGVLRVWISFNLIVKELRARSKQCRRKRLFVMGPGASTSSLFLDHCPPGRIDANEHVPTRIIVAYSQHYISGEAGGGGSNKGKCSEFRRLKKAGVSGGFLLQLQLEML